MQPTILVVFEKPFATRRLLPVIERANLWPDHKCLALEMSHPLGRFDFNYTHGLTFSDIPVVAEPNWRPREGAPWTRHVDTHGQVASYDLDPDAALRSAAQIVFACDPDVRGAMAFHTLISQTLGEVATSVPRPAIWLNSFDDESIARALGSRRTTADPGFQGLVRAGQARRFFDYNFNINAMMLFNIALRACGVTTNGAFSVSKFGLQLLYFLRGQQLRENEVVGKMHDWCGTGRYAPASLGSASSYVAILGQLRDVGLIEAPGGGKSITLSTTGSAFLDRLHPDCKDADLPQRLRQWGAEWPTSRPAVERYLRTFFGKQRRFG